MTMSTVHNKSDNWFVMSAVSNGRSSWRGWKSMWKRGNLGEGAEHRMQYRQQKSITIGYPWPIYMHFWRPSLFFFLCIGLAMSFPTWQTDRQRARLHRNKAMHLLITERVHPLTLHNIIVLKKINNHNTNIFAPFSWRQQPQETPQQTHAGLLLTGWPHKQQ